MRSKTGGCNCEQQVEALAAEKMIQECKDSIAVGNYKWIFANHELFATHG